MVGARSTVVSAIVQSPEFIDTLRAHGMPSITTIHAGVAATPAASSDASNTSAMSIVGVTVGATGLAAVFVAAYVYWRTHKSAGAVVPVTSVKGAAVYLRI